MLKSVLSVSILVGVTFLASVSMADVPRLMIPSHQTDDQKASTRQESSAASPHIPKDGRDMTTREMNQYLVEGLNFLTNPRVVCVRRNIPFQVERISPEELKVFINKLVTADAGMTFGWAQNDVNVVVTSKKGNYLFLFSTSEDLSRVLLGQIRFAYSYEGNFRPTIDCFLEKYADQ